MRNPCSTLLNLSHRVKMLLYSSVGAFHFLCKFPLSFDANFRAKVGLVALDRTQLDGQKRGASLRSKFPFLNLAYQSRAVLSAMAPSPHSTNVASNFCALRILIKSKKKEVSEMLNLTFHFNDLKINRN